MKAQNNGRILGAELVGTTVLMLGGPGVAILQPEVGYLGISLGFGFSLMIIVYCLGPVSGGHINPAVTLGMFLARKINLAHALFAWTGQILGCVLGATIVYSIASGQQGYERGQFAANLWTAPDGRYFGIASTIVVEVLLTALLVLVWLFTTTRKFAPAMGGLTVGITLALIHMISIQVDATGVNPARSLGTALFADPSFEALQQLWAFIVFPLIGAALGVLLWITLDESRLEDTLLVKVPGFIDARDKFEIGTLEAVDHIEDVID